MGLRFKVSEGVLGLGFTECRSSEGFCRGYHAWHESFTAAQPSREIVNLEP